MNSKMLGTLAALALTIGFADTGCMRQSSDPQSDDGDEITDVQEDLATPADDKAAEDTGEAHQAWWGGGGWWGGGWWGGGWRGGWW